MGRAVKMACLCKVRVVAGICLNTFMSRNNLKDVCGYLKKRGSHDNVMDLCVGFREGARRMK